MTDFEQQIAEALAQNIRTIDGNHTMSAGELGWKMSFRVAAAIDKALQYVGHPADRENARNAALTALSGARALHEEPRA